MEKKKSDSKEDLEEEIKENYEEPEKLTKKTMEEVNTEYIMKLQYAKFDDYTTLNVNSMLVNLGISFDKCIYFIQIIL